MRPPDMEAPAAGEQAGAGEQGGEDVEIVSDLHARRKAVANLKARAALAGIALERLADGTWLAQRGGMFRPLPDVASVEAFLAQVGSA